MTDLHTCSYFCDRPACIKAQRDEWERAALCHIYGKGWRLFWVSESDDDEGNLK